MLKRIISLMMAVLLSVGFLACSQEEGVESIEDISPKMEYGVWETEILKSEPGNYDRSARVSNGSFAETAGGYYRCERNLLYYADKSAPDNWVILCNKPKCGHSTNSTSTCSAYVPGGACFYNGRIYYLRDAKVATELYTGKKSGYILCSMAMDGSDQKAEFIWEEAMLSSEGGYSADICQDGIVIGIQELQTDGQVANRLYLADAEGARCISYETEKSFGETKFAKFADYYPCVEGRIAFNTNLVKFDSSIYSTISWLEDDGLHSADLSEYPYYGAYYFDGNVRIFRTNDGYYDVDLNTMEEVRLCDAQLENSGMRVLQANCVLESNLFQQNTFDPYDRNYTELPRVGEGALRLFNGQEWLDVELPEELRNLPDGNYLSATTLTGEYVICTAKIDGAQRYYRIDLGAENLKLEYWFEMNT